MVIEPYFILSWVPVSEHKFQKNIYKLQTRSPTDSKSVEQFKMKIKHSP